MFEYDEIQFHISGKNFPYQAREVLKKKNSLIKIYKVLSLVHNDIVLLNIFYSNQQKLTKY